MALPNTAGRVSTCLSIGSIYVRRFLVPLFLLLGLSPVQAQFTRDANHPELTWSVLDTEHFRIYYHQGLDGFAKRVADAAESVYGPVTDLYAFEPDEKVRLILRDTDDYANGVAYYYHNTIEIWATNLEFELRSTTDWVRNVIAHEFTHVISLQTARKAPRRMPALYLHFFGYQSEGRRDDILTGYPNVLGSYAIPMTMVPMWFAEGTAQYMASGVQYDRWDSHRDMILRMGALNGELLTYDEMGTFGAKTGLGFEKVYDHGYSLALFIVNTFGEDKLVELFRKMTSFWRIDFEGAAQATLGISGRELHRRWVSSLEERYRVQQAEIGEGATEGEVIREEGYFNFYPRWSPDGTRLAYLSNAGSDYGRTALIVRTLADSTEELAAGGATSAFGWARDGGHFVFSRRSRADRFGSRFWDLYTVDPTVKDGTGPLGKLKGALGLPAREPPGERRITHGLRASHPAYSPDGSAIAFVANGGGTTNLAAMDVGSKAVRMLTDFDDGTQVFTPKWSPSGDRIAFSVFRPGGSRDIAVIPTSGGDITPVVASPGSDRDPCWTADGSGMVFSSDVDGIFDLYHLDSESGEVHRVTRVLGGAFQPDISPADGRIAFAHYGAGGYEIRGIDDRGLWQPVERGLFSPGGEPPPAPRPAEQQDVRGYRNEFSTLSILPRFAWDAGKPKVGFFAGSDDVLGKQSLFVGGMVSHDLDTDLFGMYEYRRWRPTVFFEVYRQTRGVEEDVVNRDEDYRIFNRDFNLNEIDLGIRYRTARGNELDARAIYSRYGTTLDQSRFNGLNRGTVGATYLNGFDLALTYRRSTIAPALDSEINPRSGREVTIRYDRFFNYFLSGFQENSSIVIELYDRYFYNKVTTDWSEYVSVGPGRSTLGFRFYGGFIDKGVDDFFDFRLGGLPYLKGYTFYSLEGSRAAMARMAYRFPLWTRIRRQTGPIFSDHVYGSIYAGVGRAWDGDELDASLKRGWKRDVGAQVRYEGTSFYAFPTRMSFDVSYGLDTVPLAHPGDPERRGGLKFYFTILFGYLESVGKR